MKWIFSLFKVIYAGHSSAKFKKITEEWGGKTIIYKLRLTLNEFIIIKDDPSKIMKNFSFRELKVLDFQ
jgi:hypothetical protein